MKNLIVIIALLFAMPVFAQTDTDPTTEQAIRIKVLPLKAGEVAVDVHNTAATPVAVFTTDLTQNKNSVIQEILVTNTSATKYMCMKTTTMTGNCGVLTMTCLTVDGVSNGQPIAPGERRGFSMTSKDKACVLMEDASVVKFIGERIVRKP